MEWIFYVWWLVPLAFIALSVLAGAYKLIGQPIVEAITRMAEARGSEQDIANHPGFRELEQNVARLEQSVNNMLEEQAFQHELLRSLTTGAKAHADQDPDIPEP